MKAKAKAKAKASAQRKTPAKRASAGVKATRALMHRGKMYTRDQFRQLVRATAEKAKTSPTASATADVSGAYSLQATAKRSGVSVVLRKDRRRLSRYPRTVGTVAGITQDVVREAVDHGEPFLYPEPSKRAKTAAKAKPAAKPKTATRPKRSARPRVTQGGLFG